MKVEVKVEVEVQGARCRVQGAGYTGCKMQGARCKVQGARCRGQVQAEAEARVITHLKLDDGGDAESRQRPRTSRPGILTRPLPGESGGGLREPGSDEVFALRALALLLPARDRSPGSHGEAHPL